MEKTEILNELLLKEVITYRKFREDVYKLFDSIKQILDRDNDAVVFIDGFIRDHEEE